MMKKMRREEKLLSEEAVKEILNQAEEGVLATIGADGYPYAVPLNFAYHNDCIYFHCAKTGHKLDNIEHCDKVSFCVMTDTQIIPEKFSTRFKSVVLFGRAVEVLDEEKEEGLTALIQRYSKDYLEEGKKYIDNAGDKTRVFKIEIDRMTGKGAS